MTPTTDLSRRRRPARRPTVTAALAAAAIALTACGADGDPTLTGRPDTDAGAASDGAAAADRAVPGPEVFDEPEERPGEVPDGVTFADHGVGDLVVTADLATSTFATDADTASFDLARAWIDERGVVPPPEAIRVEEWVNAVDHGYADPAPGDTWRIVTDAGAPWWGPGETAATTAPEPDGGDADRELLARDRQLLRVGLQGARDITRGPADVTLVVDTSGSMGDGRLDLVITAVDGLLDQLDAADRVAVVAYGNQAELVSDLTADHDRVRDAVAGLRAGGSTNAEAGIALGFDVARADRRSDATDTVVLLSDGVANVGATGPEEILARVVAEAEDGITLHAVGVGMSNYHDVLLERLANDSSGGYAYVDRPEEARELFASALPVLTPLARDVKAQVEFDPRAVTAWRLVGYENRLLAAEDLRDDTVGGGFVGAGHAVTALYEIVPTGAGERLGSVTVRWDHPVTGEVDETTAEIGAATQPVVAGDATRVDADTFGTAAGVAAVAEALRGSDHVTVDLADVVARLRGTGDPQDARFAEVAERAGAALQPDTGSVPRTPVAPPEIEVEDRTGG